MKMIVILCLLIMAGCANTSHTRENSFSPTPNRIVCPDGQTAMVVKYGGGRLKSVGGERWTCVSELAFETYESDEGEW